MRRFATSLFLVILASLIFYGGAGVNFVSYCCGVCEKEGVEALLAAKCCEIHGHDHSRDNLAKVRLIPNDISRRHLKGIKDLLVMDGDASD